MSNAGRLLTALGRVRELFTGSQRSAPRGASAGRRASVALEDDSPGRHGPAATVEVDPRRLRGVSVTYSPADDAEPDPGEIVWTWVPYEERDGRGKDRPVVILATEPGETFLAAQLTSKPHRDDAEYVPLGSGPWDSQGRPSWVDLGRVFRIHPSGMRREAAALDGERFARVATALRKRYGWR